MKIKRRYQIVVVLLILFGAALYLPLPGGTEQCGLFNVVIDNKNKWAAKEITTFELLDCLDVCYSSPLCKATSDLKYSLTGSPLTVTGDGGCTDTDSGKTWFEKGTVSGHTYGVNLGEDAVDYCASETAVLEYYCSNSETSANEIYVCQDGCVDGACIVTQTTIPTTCADTDGGINYYSAGEVSGQESGLIGDTTDRCKDEDTLIEFYCDGLASASSVDYDCPSGCSFGECNPSFFDQIIQTIKRIIANLFGGGQ